LTKRNGNADEIANGSAVIASSAPVDQAPVTEEKPLSQVIEEAMESGVPVDVAEKQAVAKAEEELADKMFDQADSEQEAEETAIEDAAIEEAVAVEEIPQEEEPTEVAEETEEEPQSEYPEYEEVQDELVQDELAGETEETPEDEFVEAEVQDEVPEVAEAETVEDEPIEDEVLEDEYEAIVLVPSDSKSPESSLVDEPVIVEEEEKVVVAPAVPASGVAYLNGFDELASQKYYVQIAVYNKAENIEQIASKYADRYPITVVQQGSKSPVLVGPLNVDEYGVVLERFKSYGFKDAFVKYPR
jgi:hypothetical protein